MAALSRLVMTPPSSASRPYLATSPRRSGTRAPSEPTRIAIEPKFANPQRAKVVTSSVLGFRLPACTIGPKLENATNSLRTVFWPMKLPVSAASCQGTPISQATGAKIQPNSTSKVSHGAPNQPATPLRAPLAITITAMKAMSRQPTITARWPPVRAPRASASMTFTDSVSRTSRTDASRSDSSVSGHRPFAISSEPGAFITAAARR